MMIHSCSGKLTTQSERLSMAAMECRLLFGVDPVDEVRLIINAIPFRGETI
jgi:hypothetical protein